MFFNEVYQLDAQWRWEKLEAYGEAPSPRRGHSVVFSVLPVECLLIFGGVFGYNSFLSDLHLFDIRKRTWTNIRTEGDAPLPRGWHSASLIG